MPQLNPAPWFMILIFSWIILLTIVPLKVTAHKMPKPCTNQISSTNKTKSWPWPWL
uniref:ATP synthase complex subunit 8 n=1 Tax=Stylephorus chordatus TaxID=409996 RepID=A8QX91_STYCH|nr:ATP synthase F0 subunit 8 [Stylephorus chordatus]BAF91452.1 ATPase subunit 8 [Stylephorus chordatus]BAF91465.1 ATPase subunit 8 [Stylephorus chordatus]BAF91478.1 ATPase subunit 8 [Stylephorus chordatus]